MRSISELKVDWKEKTEYLTQFFDEIKIDEFYRFLFPEGSFERVGEYDDNKANGFLIGFDEDNKVSKRMVFDSLSEIISAANLYKTVFMSPVSYYGRRNTLSNSRYAYAVTFDIDYVSLTNLKNIIHQAEKIDHIPVPTAIVNSGTGVHLYYIFKEPIPLIVSNQILLKELKKRLTDKIWNFATSRSNEKQYQGITQSFRIIGSESKLGKEFPVKAYWVGRGEKVTLEYLNDFLYWFDTGEDLRLNIKDFRQPGKLSLEEAKKKYPEWYQKRIIEKKKPGTWICNEGLYEWWKEKIRKEVKVGHRYYSIIALVSYAKKCGIEKERVEKDAYSLVNLLNSKSIEEDNPFTLDDVESALKLYEERKLDKKTVVHFTREHISEITGVHIPKNKRNGRKQDLHLKIARNTRYIVHENWRIGNGRPSKEKIVWEYIKSHPDFKKADVIRGTGLDKKTVYKYWNTLLEEKRRIKEEQDAINKEVQNIVFTESEMTPALMQALAEKGVRSVNLVPDDEYEDFVADGFADWLLNNKD